MQKVPKGLHNFVEMIFEGFLGLIEMVVGSKKIVKEIFPYAVTLFFFVMFSNWMGLIPGVGSIGFRGDTPYEIHEKALLSKEEVPAAVSHEEASDKTSESKEVIELNAEEEGSTHHWVPLFRAGSSDLSFTLALALMTVILVQYIGIKHQHLHYFKKFINFDSPIHFFVGLLEIVSEVAKIVSFSFRLFGNIFAGEVLLLVITFLAPYMVPIPFYGLEVFVGMVQALVFMMLTLVFVKGATDAH
jgi:F-type H+-transporting ATPase subunit a